MSIGLVLPALAAIACGAVAGVVRWPLKPQVALRVLTVIAVVVAMTVGLVVVLTVVGFAARSALVLRVIAWCPVVPLHHQVGIAEGSVATVALVWSVVRIRRLIRLRRWAVEGTEGRGLLVVDSPEPIAYAAPGEPGCVVVSRGMLDVLDARERQVVLAHERAHLRQAHHRYLVAGELAVVVVPVLRHLMDQIRLATERCADEAAVTAVDGDRRLVARAIARAAVASAAHGGLVGAFGGGSIPARIDALVGPPVARRWSLTAAGFVSAAVVSAAVAGSIQVHHFVELIEHVCNL